MPFKSRFRYSCTNLGQSSSKLWRLPRFKSFFSGILLSAGFNLVNKTYSVESLLLSLVVMASSPGRGGHSTRWALVTKNVHVQGKKIESSKSL